MDSLGRIVVAAWAEPDKPSYRPEQICVARLLPNGTLDATFGEGGAFGTDFAGGAVPADLDVTPDDEITVVADTARHELDQRVTRVLRLDATGAPAAGYGTAGVATFAMAENLTPWASAPTADGGVLVAAARYGSFTYVVKLTAEGALDQGFGEGGWVTVKGGFGVTSMTELPDGRVVLAATRTATASGSSGCSPTGRGTRRTGPRASARGRSRTGPRRGGPRRCCRSATASWPPARPPRTAGRSRSSPCTTRHRRRTTRRRLPDDPRRLRRTTRRPRRDDPPRPGHPPPPPDDDDPPPPDDGIRRRPATTTTGGRRRAASLLRATPPRRRSPTATNAAAPRRPGPASRPAATRRPRSSSSRPSRASRPRPRAPVRRGVSRGASSPAAACS